MRKLYLPPEVTHEETHKTCVIRDVFGKTLGQVGFQVGLRSSKYRWDFYGASHIYGSCEDFDAALLNLTLRLQYAGYEPADAKLAAMR